MKHKINRKKPLFAENTHGKILLLTGAIFLAFLAIALFLPALVRAASLTYVPLEEIPGMAKTGDFKTYIVGIYKFGIWTVGISALLMIMIGGFMYISSAGNNASMGKAKNVITDAIIGLIMALTAWLLLNTINPDLLKIKALVTSGTNTGTQTAAQVEENRAECKKECATRLSAAEITACNNACDAEAARQLSTNDTAKTAQNQAECDSYCSEYGYTGDELTNCKATCMSTKTNEQANNSTASTTQAACEKYWTDWYGGDTNNSDYQTNLSSCRNAPATASGISDGKCSQMDSAISQNSSGVDPATLKAIMVGGEGCSKKLSYDGKGSCGYSQALPRIRAWCGISGTAEESCRTIQNNPQVDADCAAKLIKDNERRCGSDIQGVASCYNSGRPNNCANTTSNYCGRVSNYYNSLRT